MKQYVIEWDKVRIAGDSPVVVIAEGCDNHLGSLDRAKAMVRAAKEAGADAIKFQHHLPDEEMLPDAPMSKNFDEPLYEFLKKYALSIRDHAELKKYCESRGIAYLCTPFSWPAALELAEIGLEVFKIGSGEMRDVYYLENLARLGRPLIISTGMSGLKEIDKTYGLLEKTNLPFCLMNCLSEYPPRYEDLNLNVIGIMHNRYPKAIIGHSDHTPTLYTSYAAVALGAKIIEKHVTIDKKLPGPDRDVSIDFSELAELVRGIRIIEKAFGTSKQVNEREEPIRKWAYRSIVAKVAISAGQTLTREMLCTKRPGTGILSEHLHDVVGSKALRDIMVGEMISWGDVERRAQ